MDLEQYRQWLKKNGNQEEQMAYEIAREIINYHLRLNEIDEWSADLKPHFWYKTSEEHLEYDLLIDLQWKNVRRYHRLIGVEFKETDYSRVVEQAILRSKYVDYMWIATRDVFANEVALLEIIDHGIGWVIWERDFVKVLIPARIYKESRVSELLRYMAERELRRAAERLVSDANVAQGIRSLFEFI